MSKADDPALADLYREYGEQMVSLEVLQQRIAATKQRIAEALNAQAS